MSPLNGILQILSVKEKFIFIFASNVIFLNGIKFYVKANKILQERAFRSFPAAPLPSARLLCSHIPPSCIHKIISNISLRVENLTRMAIAEWRQICTYVSRQKSIKMMFIYDCEFMSCFRVLSSPAWQTNFHTRHGTMMCFPLCSHVEPK